MRDERVDRVVIGTGDRAAFAAELAGRAPSPRVRVEVAVDDPSAVAPGEVCLSTLPLEGAKEVDVAHAAAAALTGRLTDPALVRAPGRPAAG